jgi:hypothetical protein
MWLKRNHFPPYTRWKGSYQTSKCSCLCCSVRCFKTGLPQTLTKRSLWWIISEAEPELICSWFATSIVTLLLPRISVTCVPQDLEPMTVLARDQQQFTLPDPPPTPPPPPILVSKTVLQTQQKMCCYWIQRSSVQWSILFHLLLLFPHPPHERTQTHTQNTFSTTVIRNQYGTTFKERVFTSQFSTCTQ